MRRILMVRKPYVIMLNKGYLTGDGISVLSDLDKMMVDLNECLTCQCFVDMYSDKYKGCNRDVDSLLGYVKMMARREVENRG